MQILISFMPWILYGIISSYSYFYAILAAFVASVIISAPNIKKKNLKILDIGSLAFFIVLFIIAVTPDLVELKHWTHTLSNTALCLIVVVSIVIRKPFTIQYAKETVDPKYWETEGFIKTNYIISSVWGLGFAITALCSFVSWEWPEFKYFFNTIIPIAITVIMIMFTKQYPEYVKAKKLKELKEQEQQNLQQEN